jgi:hypothetical protein
MGVLAGPFAGRVLAVLQRRGAGGWGLPAALLLSLIGCYSPKIVDGGLICASGGKCPDGFQCNPADNHCYTAGSGCATPAVTALCQDPPATGSACNPTCQTGCACGRCNVSGLAAVCAPFIGTGALGQVCTPERDNCQAGFICLLEACGSQLGRCYRHCATAAQCPDGTSCEIPILNAAGTDTGFRTCGLAPQACDPIAKTGCPAAALGCYLDSAGSTICDCPSNAAVEGGACNTYNDCAAGLTCVGGSGTQGGSQCRPICLQSKPTCATGKTCLAVGSTYGYCF